MSLSNFARIFREHGEDPIKEIDNASNKSASASNTHTFCLDHRMGGMGHHPNSFVSVIVQRSLAIISLLANKRGSNKQETAFPTFRIPTKITTCTSPTFTGCNAK
jgi:hypothetical protein